MSQAYYISRFEKEQLIDAQDIDKALSDLIQRVQKEGYQEIFVKVSQTFNPDHYNRKIDALKTIGFTTLQKKNIFTLSGKDPLIEVPERLTFQPLHKNDRPYLRDLIIASFQNTLDNNDLSHIKESTIETWADHYLKDLNDHYSFEYNWWHLGINSCGEVIGFVLPVLFDKRIQLRTGTFILMATLPQHRGNGYVHDLLKKGTRLLQDIGISRIYTDADVNNFPMKNAFKAAGYLNEDSVEILELKLN